MSYATIPELIARMGVKLYELLNVADGADISANAPLLSAIADANAEVDSYLAGQYALPLPTVPAQLVGYACDIARYKLIAATRIDILTEADQSAFRDAVRYLRDISKGEARLTAPGAEAFTAAGQSEIAVVGSLAIGPVSNQSWMEGY